MRIFFKDDDRLPELPPGHVTVYELARKPPEYEGPKTLRVSPEHLHGCRIVRRWIASETEITAVRELFMAKETYGDRGLGARCYFPGFAFTFGQSTGVVDVLICLECRWVVFHFTGRSVSMVPTDNSLARLQEIYRTLIEKAPTRDGVGAE